MTHKKRAPKWFRFCINSYANRSDPNRRLEYLVEIWEILCMFAIIVVCSHSHVFADGMRPIEVARIVSRDKVNERFFSAVKIDKTFDKLEIPILEGSSVLPIVTLVEFQVFDEYDDFSPWEFSGNQAERLMTLQVGPFAEDSDCKHSSKCNDVRLVIWPSGHVLWVADKGELPGAMRNRKGKIVEYRFGQIKLDKTMKLLESFISKGKSPSGYYRKSILYEHKDLFGSVRFDDLVILNKDYIFKCVSQVTEKKEDSFYQNKQLYKLSTSKPRDDVNQYIDICKAIRASLPTKGYCTLRSEPHYVWKGKRNIREESLPSQKQDSKDMKKGVRNLEEKDP